MLTRLRHGYMKIELMGGPGLLPGEGTQEEDPHSAKNNWIALYQDPQTIAHPHTGEMLHRNFFQQMLSGPAKSPPAPYDHGIGRTKAALNYETGRAERSIPYEIRVLKEGFGSASGSILQAMFQNIRIKHATFDFTKQNPKGEEVIAFQIEIKDGAFSEWEVRQDGGGSQAVETLEYVSIVASQITFLKEPVWADQGGHGDGEERVFGGFHYEKRQKL